MKKRKLLFIVLVLFLGSFFTYISHIHKDVPELLAYYNGEPVKVELVAYRWNSGFKTKTFVVDTYASVISKLNKKETIPRKGKVNLEFDYTPKNIEVSNCGMDDDNVYIKNNIIYLKEELQQKNDYQYILFLDCEWKEGTAKYIIAI